MYGVNPSMYLAQTPYARLTGQYQSYDNLQYGSTYAQPMFVDTNLYTGNSGIPVYPTLVGNNPFISPSSNYSGYNSGYSQPSYGSYSNYSQPSYGYSSYGQQQSQPLNIINSIISSMMPRQQAPVQQVPQQSQNQSQLGAVVGIMMALLASLMQMLGAQQPQQQQPEPPPANNNNNANSLIINLINNIFDSKADETEEVPEVEEAEEVPEVDETEEVPEVDETEEVPEVEEADKAGKHGKHENNSLKSRVNKILFGE